MSGYITHHPQKQNSHKTPKELYPRPAGARVGHQPSVHVHLAGRRRATAPAAQHAGRLRPRGAGLGGGLVADRHRVLAPPLSV